MSDTIPSLSKEESPQTCPPSSLPPPQPSNLSELPPAPMTPSDEAVPQIFHRFLDLPSELRVEIWKFSLPHRVHTFPRPAKKFNFLDRSWTQEQIHGAKAAQPSAIAHVCSEARAVALSNGSVKKIKFDGGTEHNDELSHVWVDPKRDTVLLKLNWCVPRGDSGKLCTSQDIEHLYTLLSNRDMHIALDFSWTMAGALKLPARKVYYDLVHGLKVCDFVVVDLQLDVTDEQAASTGLFGEFGANRSVLIPIHDTCQMSRVFDAESKFSAEDLLERWRNFTQFRRPANLVEFIQRWKDLGAREMRNLQWGLDYLIGVERNAKVEDADELREKAARDAELRQSLPMIRPVIMVSRGAES